MRYGLCRILVLQHCNYMAKRNEENNQFELPIVTDPNQLFLFPKWELFENTLNEIKSETSKELLCLRSQNSEPSGTLNSLRKRRRRRTQNRL